MTNDDSPAPDRDEIHRAFAMAAHHFPEWEQGSTAKLDFMSGEVVELLVALGAALVVVDKQIGAVEALVKRARAWYKWLRERSTGAQKRAEPPTTSGRERLLVILFDLYLTERKAAPLERLSALSGLTAAECAALLQDLLNLGLVQQASAGGWRFRRR
jgi:hypothetical protein